MVNGLIDAQDTLSILQISDSIFKICLLLLWLLLLLTKHPFWYSNRDFCLCFADCCRQRPSG